MDRALEQAKEGVVDVMGIVNDMRQQRMKMIQTLVSTYGTAQNNPSLPKSHSWCIKISLVTCMVMQIYDNPISYTLIYLTFFNALIQKCTSRFNTLTFMTLYWSMLFVERQK